jgi:hypothetical protein
VLKILRKKDEMISTLQRELEESNYQAKNMERNMQLAIPSPEV